MKKTETTSGHPAIERATNIQTEDSTMRRIRNVSLLFFLCVLGLTYWQPIVQADAPCWAPSGHPFDEYEECWYGAELYCVLACENGCGRYWSGYGADPDYGMECHEESGSWLLRCKCDGPWIE